MAGEEIWGAGRTVPIGMVAVLAIAAGFYAAMLVDIRPAAHGAVAGDAVAWLFFTAGLWLSLSIALIVGAVGGRMPRPALWVLLQPLAGAALVVSSDFYSRHRDLPPLEPAILPLLIAFYALWARLPALRRRLPATPTSVAVGCAVAAISAVSLFVAANY